MAIIIPSKNIYNKENPKVIDNIIRQIEFEENQPNLVDEYGVLVFTNDADLSVSREKEINPTISLDEMQDTKGYHYKSIVGVKGNASYTTTYQNVFDQLQGNKYIRKVYNFNEDNPPKVTLQYEKKTYHWLTTVDQYNNFDYTFKTEDNNELVSSVIGYEGIEYDIDLLSLGDISGALDQANTSNMEAHNRLTITAYGTAIDLAIHPYIEAEVKNSYSIPMRSGQTENIATQNKDTNVITDEGKYTLQWEYLKSESEFLANLDVTMCTAFVRRYNGDFSQPAYAIATRLVLKCVGISIDAYGDTITLNDTNRLTNRIGDITSPYVFKYPSSNFLQAGNTYRGDDGSVQLATKKFLEQTLEQYKNGKETATVRCSISNYYNDYGGKIIGVDKPSRNKLPKSYDFGNKSTVSGVTATALADGGIRLEGTNTASGRIFFNLTKKSFGEKDIVCLEGTSFFTEQIEDNSYLTLSKFGEGISNVALGYNQHNKTTWLSVEKGVTVNAVVYPMLNEGQHIPYEAPDYSMAFSLYDEVIPFYRTPYGESPMSMDSDMPKVFSVLGSKVIYDGAVWQELSIQEKRKYEGSKGLSFLSDSLSGIGSFKGKYLFVPSENTAKNTTVTKIAINAFLGNKQIEYVYVSDNIKTIKTSAFQECNNLKNIYFSKSSECEYINSSAFYNCSNLIYIELPPKLTSISPYLLSGCSNLERIFIPKSVTSIGASPFSGCSKLKNVEIEDVISYCNTVLSGVSSSPFCQNAGLYSNGTLVKHLNLNSSELNEIKYAVFHGCNSIELVDLGDYVSAIRGASFNTCVNLKEIVIGKNITTIYQDAFNNSPLEKVFYKGTGEDWGKISIASGNATLESATKYYYSATQPTAQGNFWHYVNGKPKIW